MKYPIKKEFGFYASMKPPVYKPLLPIINLALTFMPKRKQIGLVISKKRIPTSDGTCIHALLMAPEGIGENAPCLVYCHGGGFMMKAAPSHYALAGEYAKETPCKVLFVQYRLVPKHTFPTQVNDCFAAYLWTMENAKMLGIDPQRIALGGDSAGGNLVAAVCLMARDRGKMSPCFQMLIYPATDCRMQTESMRLYTDTPMWNARLNAKMWRWYLPEDAGKDITYASPAEAVSLTGLPNAYIETAEFDCLRDEGLEYAVALQAANVCVELNETRGTMHGFDTVLNSSVVRECMARRVNALKREFY